MRLIDADEYKKLIEEFCVSDCGCCGNSIEGCPCGLIDKAPTVEIDEGVIQKVLNSRCMTAVSNEYLMALHGQGERPHGKWIFKHNSSDIWCSVCDENFDEIPQKFNYCPNCGADMRKESNE